MECKVDTLTGSFRSLHKGNRVGGRSHACAHGRSCACIMLTGLRALGNWPEKENLSPNLSPPLTYARIQRALCGRDSRICKRAIKFLRLEVKKSKVGEEKGKTLLNLKRIKEGERLEGK